MNKQYESVYHDAELHNWWFAARRSFVKGLLKKYNISKDAAIIDIGCAGGVLLYELAQEGFTDLTALDYSAEAIALCKERGIEQAYVMDGHRPEFPDHSFDVVIASDSLEHLEDDVLALQSWYRILKPGGKLFVFVPAYQSLWSAHDVINLHYRRYTKAGLLEKATGAGFRKLQSGYWNNALLIPTALMRLVKGKPKEGAAIDEGGDIVALPKPLNAMLTAWLHIEGAIAKHISMPAGVSAFAVLTK